MKKPMDKDNRKKRGRRIQHSIVDEDWEENQQIVVERKEEEGEGEEDGRERKTKKKRGKMEQMVQAIDISRHVFQTL